MAEHGSDRGRTQHYLLVALGGVAMGVAVMVLVVLTAPDRALSGGQLVALFIGIALLGGLATFLRSYLRDRAQAAGKSMRAANND